MSYYEGYETFHMQYIKYKIFLHISRPGFPRYFLWCELAIKCANFINDLNLRKLVIQWPIKCMDFREWRHLNAAKYYILCVLISVHPSYHLAPGMVERGCIILDTQGEKGLGNSITLRVSQGILFWKNDWCKTSKR